MRQQFAVFLGDFRGDSGGHHVDKRPGVAQHVAIGMLGEVVGLTLGDQSRENPVQRSGLALADTRMSCRASETREYGER
jgi:hypothetical protein